MSDIEKIQLFENKKVRTIWIESEGKWYFSIKDVILVLADAKDPKDYLSKMRRRNPELAKGWGQNVHPLTLFGLSTKKLVFLDYCSYFCIKYCHNIQNLMFMTTKTA